MAKKKPYRFFLYLVCRLLAACLSVLPRSLNCWIAKHLGPLGYYLIARQRDKTLNHLNIAYGDSLTDDSKKLIAEKVFQNLAMTAADWLKFPSITEKNISNYVDFGDSLETYQSLLKEGKGLISMTAHLGNWELLAGSFGLKGFDGAVLARRIYYEPYNKWIVGLRQKMNVRTIYRDSSSREILHILSRNEIVGLLPDQDMASLKGIFVKFFDRLAYTPIAPIRLALSSGSPMITNFLIRGESGKYKVVVGDVIRANKELPRDEAIRVGTEQWMQSFENVIRKHPDQWAWMHNRWKTQPEDLKQTSKVKAETIKLG